MFALLTPHLGPLAVALIAHFNALPDGDPRKGPLLDALLALLANPAFLALIIKLLGGLGGP